MIEINSDSDFEVDNHKIGAWVYSICDSKVFKCEIVAVIAEIREKGEVSISYRLKPINRENDKAIFMAFVQNGDNVFDEIEDMVVNT